MSITIIKNIEQFLSMEGKCLGTSEWLAIDQNVINHFADSTFDHQWIHVDTERAKTDSPYKTTIAHGYLTLSLIPHFLNQIIEVENLKQLVNYCVDKMVFRSAVPVNSKLRMKASLKSAKDLGNICKASIQCLFEVEGKVEPVLDGTIVFLYYFK